MICSFLFAALLFFICSVPLLYLQRSSFLFAAFLFFICSVPLFCLQRSFFYICSGSLFCLQRFFFVCSVPFLFAAFLFCLQRFFFVCSVSVLFAAFLFCLQRFCFVCSVSVLFAAFLFCLQRFCFVCSVSFLFAAFLFCLQRVPCGPPYYRTGQRQGKVRQLNFRVNLAKALIGGFHPQLPWVTRLSAARLKICRSPQKIWGSILFAKLKVERKFVSIVRGWVGKQTGGVQ